MTRRLILMRHAKSSWNSDAPSDHARPLNKRGRRDAPRVGAHLAERGWVPELAWSSDAARTRETWERMSEAFDDADAIDVHWDARLYGGGLDDLVAAADGWPDEVVVALTLGHNPGWEDALGRLAGEGHAMTTGNAALLEGAGDTWIEALEGPWRLVELVRPRALDEA